MKALSIRQPWAWAILHAGKRVENRTWRTAFRGPFLIHAPKRIDHDMIPYLMELGHDPALVDLHTSGIVGSAIVVDCVRPSQVPAALGQGHFSFGPWCLVLDDVRELPFYPCRGALGFFDIDPQPEWEGR